MKKLSIPELQSAVRKVVNQIDDLQDAGKPVPHSLTNRWIRLYKQLEKLEKLENK